MRSLDLARALRRALTMGLLVLPLAAAAVQGFYRTPAVHGAQLWFSAEGDLWHVALDGGRAERVTTHPGLETQPAVSPDGRWLAFVGNYEGTPEAYVMPVAGGTPRRLSWFGTRPVQVWGWTPAGEVLVSGPSASGAPDTQLYAIDATTQRQRQLPVGQASDGAVSADGRTLYFTRNGLRGDNARGYRGGAMARLWRIALDGNAEAVPLFSGGDANANQSRPMPYRIGSEERIAFLSDRGGRMQLWSANARGGDLKQHTAQRDFDVRSAALHGTQVVYAIGADLHRLDLAGGNDRRIEIALAGDFDPQRTRWLARPQDYLSHVALAPDGERVALTVRGHVFTQGSTGWRRAEAALPDDARCRRAEFSHDGKQLYALCDMSPKDEVEVWRLAANGVGAAQPLTTGAKVMRERIVPSPDGQWLALVDKEQALWLLSLKADNAPPPRRVDGPGIDGDSDIAWSADGKLLAYTRSTAPSYNDRVYLYSVDSGRAEALTSDRYPSRSPAFTPDGKWLYYLSDRQFAPLVGYPWGDRNMGPFFDRRGRAYAVPLQAGLRFPFQPRDELEPPTSARAASAPSAAASAASAPAAPASAPTVASDIAQGRALYQVPLPAGNYSALRSDGKRLYVLERDGTPEGKTSLRTLAIDNSGAQPELFAADVRQIEVTPDGKRLLVVRSAAGGGRGDILLLDAAAKLPADIGRNVVRWADAPIAVEPRAEWRQMFADAWRMQRDFFYDPGLHGVDWRAVRARYEPLVERVTDRSELNELLAQMVGELGLLHSQVFTPDLRSGPDAGPVAGLGARFAPVADGLRIEQIYRGDAELPGEAGPLLAAGLDVRVGAVLTAINGRPVREPSQLAALLRGQAGRPVLLGLRDAPGAAERQLLVTPVDGAREAALRYTDWEWRRAERALTRSNGRVGYLHLRAMTGPDIATFAREFYAHIDREALIIDVRGNGGGSIDSWIIEKLMRRAWAWWQPRSPADALPYSNMQQTFRGHLAVLIDENTYSDGETFAAGVQRLKLGALIGRRTSGAGVWLSDRNRLLDNGLARAAESGQFTPDGQWLIEGRGVAPDIEVDNPPRATFAGGDAQLDAAIEHLQKRLAEQPVVLIPKAPAYPRPPLLQSR